MTLSDLVLAHVVPMLDIRGPYCPKDGERPRGFIDEAFHADLRLPEIQTMNDIEHILNELADWISDIDGAYGCVLDRGSLFDAFLSRRLNPSISEEERLDILSRQILPVMKDAQYISLTLTELCPGGKDLTTGTAQLRRILSETRASVVLVSGTPAFPILYDRDIRSRTPYLTPYYLSLESEPELQKYTSRIFVEVPDGATNDLDLSQAGGVCLRTTQT